MRSQALQPFRLPTGELLLSEPEEKNLGLVGALYGELLKNEVVSFALTLFVTLSTLWIVGS